MAIKKDLSIEEEFMELSKPKKKRINSKQKGNTNEREFAKILNDRFGENKFRRTPMSGAFVGGMNRGTGAFLTEEQKQAFASDIITPTNFKFILEHKAYAEMGFWDLFNESSPINEWIKQVEGDAEFVHKKPLIIAKFNNKKRIVFTKEKVGNYIFEFKGWYCLWLTDFLSLEDGFFFD